MIEAVKEWRKPISFDDMEHDTRHALELAKQNPGKDHNDIAKLERKSLAAMPGKPDGFEWDDNGQPKGISQDDMFKLKRRETLTGMDITETSPDVEKQATASNSNNVFQRAKEEQSSVAENKNESRNRFGLN